MFCMAKVPNNNSEVYDVGDRRLTKIGRSILCGWEKIVAKFKNEHYIVHSQLRKFLETRDNKPLWRVARQHT